MSEGRLLSPSHHFGLVPEYSDDYLAGVAYRTDLRIFLLTNTIKTDEGRAKLYGWTNMPSLDLYPLTEHQQSAVVRAVERRYLQAPTVWEETRTIKIGGRDAVEMSGWSRHLKKFGYEYFQEIRAIPLPGERILLIHSHYSHLSKKQLNEQRRIIGEIVKSLRFISNGRK